MAQKLSNLAIVLTFTLMLMTSFSSSKTFFQNPRKPVSIRATIMHRNAKGSPLHDPNATVEEIIEKDFQISKERPEYYFRKSSPKSTESIEKQTLRSLRVLSS